jgi:hypothetical protein
MAKPNPLPELPADVPTLQAMVRSLQGQTAPAAPPYPPTATNQPAPPAVDHDHDHEAAIASLRAMAAYHYGTAEQRAAIREEHKMTAEQYEKRLARDAKKALKELPEEAEEPEADPNKDEE